MTAAAGVSGVRPPASTRSTSDSRLRIPIRITRVSAARASSSKRVWTLTLVGSLWPVTTAKEAE